jgi:4-amino-4-deoxychorismate lyase
MSLFLESIKLVDGKFRNLFYHEQRMMRSLHTLCGADEAVDLERFLVELDFPKEGVYKCRIEYDEHTRQVEFLPYQPKAINSLKIVESDRISYDFKFKDRSKIDKLFENREACDDILIVKKGKVTDSSYANVVFKKADRWYTPWSALLKGTMRQQLIEQNQIEEQEIRLEDIKSFDTFKLINAMLEFNAPEIEVSKIVF